MAGREKLNGDIIYCFMRGVAEDEINQGRRVCVLSNYLLTDLVRKKRKSFFLNEVIRSCEKILTSEILIIPCHQESRDHWSVLSLYPITSIIVHCDSLPNAALDNALMRPMSLLFSKLTKYSGRGYGKKWFFLPMHKCGSIPVQKDSVSCGLYTCIFSYSLLLSMDFAIKEEFFPKFYFWIAHHAMKGAMCEVEVPARDRRTLWDDVQCKLAPISGIENIPMHKDGPFTSLSNFIREKEKRREGSDSEASLDSSSSEESSTNNNDMNCKEFKAFCVREAGKLCAHTNGLQPQPLGELLGVSTEWLSAVIALRPSRFKLLQENEEFPVMRNFLRCTVYKLMGIVQKIFCKTVRNEDEKLFSTVNKLEFAISRTWGMFRSQFIERVIFPEILTHFLKENYQETYEQATGRMYGKSGKSKTVYWEDVCKKINTH